MVIASIYVGYFAGLTIGTLTYDVLGLSSATDLGRIMAWLTSVSVIIILVKQVANSIERGAELEQIRKIRKIIDDIKEE